MANGYLLDIARQYIKANEGLSKTAISRLMAKDYPELFSTSEHARNAVRSVTGSRGKHDRERTKNQIEFKLPEPDLPNTEAYVLPKNIQRLGLISDIHIPYHCTASVTAAVSYFKAENIQALLINGDLMDIYMWSKHQKDRRKRDMGGEIRMTREFLFWLRQELPDTIIYFKWGNHDLRWNKYLSECDPALLDIDDFQLSTVLRFGELKIIDTQTHGPIMAGKLPIFHGHELGMTSGGVNPARSLALKTNVHGLTSHFHKTSSHAEPHYRGGHKITYSVGCMCNLYPEYMQVNKWNNGFADVTIQPNGDFSVKNLRVQGGVIYE